MKETETDKPLFEILEAVSVGSFIGLICCSLICLVLWMVREGIIY